MRAGWRNRRLAHPEQETSSFFHTRGGGYRGGRGRGGGLQGRGALMMLRALRQQRPKPPETVAATTRDSFVASVKVGVSKNKKEGYR